MAVAVCGCRVARRDDHWVVAEAEPECPFAHVVGLRGWIEGEPAPVTGVGACVTIVFERSCERPSRTAMVTTPSEAPRTVDASRIATPQPRKAVG